MIKIVHEIELEYFEAWSGGKAVLDNIKAHDKCDEIIEYIESLLTYETEQGIITETWLNDFLWFDVDQLLIDDLDINIFE